MHEGVGLRQQRTNVFVMKHQEEEKRFVLSRKDICDALNGKSVSLSCVASIDSASGDVVVRCSEMQWHDDSEALRVWRKKIHLEVASVARSEWTSVKLFTHWKKISPACATCGAVNCGVVCSCGCFKPNACPGKKGGGRCKPAYRKFFAAVLVCSMSHLPKKAWKAQLKRVNQSAAFAVLQARCRGHRTIFGTLPWNVLLHVLSFVTEPFGLYRRRHLEC